MNKFSVFVKDDYFGDGVQLANHSWAYVCPKCGEVWARIVNHAENAEWFPRRRFCHEHANGFLDPVLTDDEPRWYVSWPVGVLKHDFLVLMSLKEQVIPDNRGN